MRGASSVRNLLIDYSLRVASPGVVRKTSDGLTTIRIADEYPVGPSTRVAAVTRFDVRARAWPESPVQAYFPDNVTMPAAQTFASPSFSQFADGDEVLVRHYVYEGHAIVVNAGASDIAFEDITIYSAPGMGWVVSTAERGFRFTRCRIERRASDPLRLISTAADGIHIYNTLGDIIIEDNDFSGHGDDSVNIYTLYLRVVQISGSNRLTIHYPNNVNLVKPGDELRFVKAADLSEYARARITAIDGGNASPYTVTLDRNLPASLGIGDLVANVTRSSGTFVVRNNRFHNHYAHGILIQAPDGLVENNQLSNITMMGMHITSDSNYFFSGAGARNLLVRGNTLRRVGYGSSEIYAGGRHMGAISIVGDTATGIAAAPVHQRISIEDNHIEDVPGLAVLVASADGVAVRNNAIVRSNQVPFAALRTGVNIDAAARGSIMITRASNVTVAGNRQVVSPDMFDSGVYVDPRNTSGISIDGGPPNAGGAPTGLVAQVSGLSVSLSWQPSAGAASYVLEAGTASSLSNAFVGNIGSATALQTQGPAGTYFVRVRAQGALGLSGPSNEVSFTLSTGGCSLPAAVGNLTASRSGNLLRLSWTAAAGATAYQLEAGTATGLSNVFDGSVGGATAVQFDVATVPANTYYVRVKAVGPCGVGAASNELVLTVP